MTQKHQLTLYSFRRCPYAMRARMALSYARLNYELREVDLKNKPEAMLMASPKGTVPILMIDTNTIIDESLDVVSWVSKQTDHPLDYDINQDEWVLKLHDAFVPTMHRYKYPERYPDVDQSENLTLINTFLSDLDNWLGQQGNHLNPWIEIALFPLIRQLWIIEDGWQHQAIPHVSQWVDATAHSDAFQRVMHKYDVWKPTDEPTIISNQ